MNRDTAFNATTIEICNGYTILYNTDFEYHVRTNGRLAFFCYRSLEDLREVLQSRPNGK